MTLCIEPGFWLSGATRRLISSSVITGEWIVGEGDGPAAQTARAAAMVSGDASSASRSNSRAFHKDFRPNHTQPFFGKMLFQLRRHSHYSCQSFQRNEFVQQS